MERARSVLLLWRKCLTICSLILILCGASPLWAQQAGGIIAGAVYDPTGAVVPEANVIVTNLDTGEEYETRTNSSGTFTTPSLRIGRYSVRASRAGFKATVERNLVLEVDARVEVNIKLQVGEASESVTVEAEGASVDTSSAVLSTVVAREPIENLPLNGRNTLALVLLTPGVRSNAGSVNSGFADRGSQLSSISINGSPNAMNNNQLDGGANIQTYTGELALNPATDAITEFSVRFGAMPAEYGFTAGGIINMATRSGTNSFHGALYEYFRNDFFDAITFIPPTTTGSSILPKPKLRYNQFGAAIGGPVLHDKVFFFANYEEFRYNRSTPKVGTVPTLLERTGDFSDSPFVLYDPATTKTVNGKVTRATFANEYGNGNKIPASRIDPVALAMQNTFFPMPNRPPSDPQNDNNYAVNTPNTRWMRQAIGRVDYHLSSRQTMFLRYGYYDFFNDNGGSSFYTDPPAALRYDDTASQSVMFQHTFSFSPSLINELRLSANRTYFPFVVANANQGWPQKLGLPASVPSTTLPQIESTTLPNFNTGQETVGVRASTNPQLVDIITFVHGSHNIRFGFDYRLNRGNNIQTAYPSGDFTFGSGLTGNPQALAGTGHGYATFLLGAVASAQATSHIGEAERNFNISGFIDDVVRVSPRTTFDFGMRYDYQSPPVEQNNSLSTFNPYLVSSASGLLGALQFAGINGAPHSFIGNDITDFGPRVGFAWDVFGNGSTAFRGGFGIYYVNTFNTVFFGDTTGFATTTTSYTPSGGVGNINIVPAFQFSQGFPSPVITPIGAKLGPDGLLGGQGTAVYTPHDGTIPRSTQFDAAVQRQLPFNTALEISYAYNHGLHMAAGTYNMNTLNPSYLSLGDSLRNPVPNPYYGRLPTGSSLNTPTITRQQSLLPYPYYSTINVKDPRDGTFINHALMLKVTHTSSKGFTFIATYTKSKLIDFSIQPAVSFALSSFANTSSYQNPYDRQAERSLDPNDVSQRATISVIYHLPFGRGMKYAAGANVFVDALISGWQFNAITLLQTGVPLGIRGASSNVATRPNFNPGISPKLPHSTIQAWFNKNAFINPPDKWTYGNVPRYLANVRAPGTWNEDLSVFKTVPIHDNLTLQLRLEGFNAFNHINPADPNQNFSADNLGHATGTFGSITAAAHDARVAQIAARLTF